GGLAHDKDVPGARVDRDCARRRAQGDRGDELHTPDVKHADTAVNHAAIGANPIENVGASALLIHCYRAGRHPHDDGAQDLTAAGIEHAHAAVAERIARPAWYTFIGDAHMAVSVICCRRDRAETDAHRTQDRAAV